ncbi:MAG TPA: hypothetical protein VF782_10420 [Allosphingosinicella sp.]|jgi:hypothetical protein
MYGQYQGSGRPEPLAAPTYGASPARPGADQSAGRPGVNQSWVDYLGDLIKLQVKATLGLPEAVKREIWRGLCAKAKPYLPKRNHPAIRTYEHFIRNEEKIELFATNSKSIYEINPETYVDILQFPEIRKAIEARIESQDYSEKEVDISRNLSSEGQTAYILSLIHDLQYNCTRALLGSFEGSIQFYAPGAKFKAVISIKNQLNWVSATRFPPSWGGYEADKNKQASFCSHVEGWETDLHYRIYID